MAGIRREIAVLHSAQYIEVNLDEVFPPGRFNVKVFTSAEPSRIWRQGVPPGSAKVVQVQDGDFSGRILQACGTDVEVITNDEFCLELCAELRREFSLPSRFPVQPAMYRNKTLMKTAVRAAGGATSDFVPLDVVRPDDVDRVLENLSLPLVAKPAEGANSRGVQVLPDRAAVHEWLQQNQGRTDYLIEEYVEGSHGHVNSVVRDGQIDHVLVGKYLGSLLALKDGKPSGSVSVAPGDPFHSAGIELAEQVLRALGTEGTFVSHVEFVLDSNGRAQLIEVAARAPGAMVSDVAFLHAGVHLVKANYALQAGLDVPPPSPTGMHAGWLWFPAGDANADAISRPSIRSPYRLDLNAVPERSERGGRFFLSGAMLVWGADPELIQHELTGIVAEHIDAVGR